VSPQSGEGDRIVKRICLTIAGVILASALTGCIFGSAGGSSGSQESTSSVPKMPGVLTRISVSSSGAQGNGPSGYSKSVSSDGRYIAFNSDATNLVQGDTNGLKDIFVRDLTAGTTTRVSVSSSGAQADGISGTVGLTRDGRYVVFVSEATKLVPGDTNGLMDVFVRDLIKGTTTLASVSNTGAEGDGDSSDCSISDDGRYVAFVSAAANLVSGDTNGEQDVFVRDLVKSTTTRVSVGNTGTQADSWSDTPDISSDGGHVVFLSEATNLVRGDTNGRQDVFVRDLEKRTTTRASVSGTGVQGDLQSQNPGISSDGRFVVFESNADGLVPGDTNRRDDIFVRDLVGGTTVRASVGADGAQGNDTSGNTAISSDGRYVVFDSLSSNLVPGDTNGFSDAFLRDMGAPSKNP
jgi:Tol biopolymer transport system component